MRSIIYNGMDFGEITRAKVIGETGLTAMPTTAKVVGWPGEVILGSAIPPKVVEIKLFLEPLAKLTVEELASIRRKLHAALLAPDGAELRYEVNYRYESAVCTDFTAWDCLFSAGSCVITFTIYDPIAYSIDKRVETELKFEVGGTFQTRPSIEAKARQGSQMKVTCITSDQSITVNHEFAAHDSVTFNFENETVAVNGADVSKDIDIASDFFYLEPGTCRLAFEGAESFAVGFYERWV